MSIEKTIIRKEINKSDETINTTISYEIIPYTQAYTYVIQNIRHLEAGFTWIYLLSKPKDWDVIKEHLKSHFNIGNDKLKEIFSYLSKHQLIEYKTIRDTKGKIVRKEIVILNGSRFLTDEEVILKQQHKELSTGDSSTGGQIHPQGLPAGGFQEATKNRVFKKEKEKQKDVFVDKNKNELEKDKYYADIHKPLNKEQLLKNISNINNIFEKNPELNYLRKRL